MSPTYEQCVRSSRILTHKLVTYTTKMMAHANWGPLAQLVTTGGVHKIAVLEIELFA